MTPDDYCQQKVAARGSSFHYAFLFLPPERRRAVTALFAFCREIEDVVQECSDLQLARAKLAWWRDEVGKLFAGRPEHPVMRALAPSVIPYGIAAERLLGLIAGAEMDLAQSRYLDFTALQRFCNHTAGTTGLLAAGVFGYREARTLEYGQNLGVALKLGTIIRDVGEDARRNRIYLPLDEMRSFGVTAADILNARHGGAFVNLMEFQYRRAVGFFDAAAASLPAQDRRAQRPGLILAGIYRALLEEIERERFQVLTHRTSLTPLRKLWIAWKTQVFA